MAEKPRKIERDTTAERETAGTEEKDRGTDAAGAEAPAAEAREDGPGGESRRDGATAAAEGEGPTAVAEGQEPAAAAEGEEPTAAADGGRPDEEADEHPATAVQGNGATRVFFFRKRGKSDVEQLLGATEATVDHDNRRIDFRERDGLDLKVGDLVASRLIASEPISRVERETDEQGVEYTVWF